MKNLIAWYRAYVVKLVGNPFVSPAMKREMAAEYGISASRQNETQLRTRSFLDQLGVSVADRLTYQAAAAEAEKKKRQYGGATLQNELNIIVNKWAARGANPALVDQLVKTIV